MTSNSFCLGPQSKGLDYKGMWQSGLVEQHINTQCVTVSYINMHAPGAHPKHKLAYVRSNRPNEKKMDALWETGGCVINCCLSPPTDNDGLYPGEFAGNRFYLEGLFIVLLIGGVVCLE